VWYSEPDVAQFVRGGELRQSPSDKAVSVPVGKPTTRGREWLPSFFHPGRIDARLAPEEFRKRLREIHPDLDACWHPMLERWQVWCRNKNIQTHWCRGWQLLFTVQEPETGEFIPLDERTLACAQGRVMRDGPNKYWDRIEAEILRDRQKQSDKDAQLRDDMVKDYFRFTEIKMSMAGPSSGSKFSNHHTE